jgi:hypothetical protein
MYPDTLELSLTVTLTPILGIEANSLKVRSQQVHALKIDPSGVQLTGAAKLEIVPAQEASSIDRLHSNPPCDPCRVQPASPISRGDLDLDPPRLAIRVAKVFEILQGTT